MKVNVKCNKATILKIAGIALGIIGTMIETAERDIAIREAVEDYHKNQALIEMKSDIS